MQEIICHIGFPKTGTTYLQKNVFPQIKNINYVESNRIKQLLHDLIKVERVNVKNNLEYDTIYVEDLTYFIMINIFKDIGYKIKSFNLSNLDKLKEDVNKVKKLILFGSSCIYPKNLIFSNSDLASSSSKFFTQILL